MNSLPQPENQQVVNFPECQLVTTNLSPEQIKAIGEAYRDKAPLPVTDDSKANSIIERLKGTTNYQG